jgi:hypothetical protein
VVSVAALLLLGLATVAVGFARQAQRETAIAEQNAHESRGRELAAYATGSLNEDPERSILLGMLAVNASLRFGQPPVPTAEDAVHQAILSSQVRLTLHHEGGWRIVISPRAKSDVIECNVIECNNALHRSKNLPPYQFARDRVL